MKKVVYTPGVWDIIHVGHLNVLKRAKLCGDYLIVGVCSDRLVLEHKKQLPVINQQQRAEIIGALKYVDEVYIYDNPDQISQLKLFNVDIFVVGEQFGFQGVPEHTNALDYCTKNNIPVVRVNRYPDLSSSIIKDIKHFWEDRAKKAKDNELGLWQSTSLTDSEEKATFRLAKELKFILNALELVPKKDSLLELGCGVGRLTNEVAIGFERVYAYDYVKEFIDLAKTKTEQKNISFFCSEAHEFNKDINYDCCLIAGLFCCLTDEQFEKTVEAIKDIPYLVIKESVGTGSRYELTNHWSEALGCNYNAIYRSVEEIKSTFINCGYNLSMDEPIEYHRLETHLRIFVFSRSENE